MFVKDNVHVFFKDGVPLEDQRLKALHFGDKMGVKARILKKSANSTKMSRALTVGFVE